jgi:DNA primase
MDIQLLKQILSITDLLQYVGLKPSALRGKSKPMRCPFHEEKNALKKTMQVYEDTNSCYCFSTKCKTNSKSIDVISFCKYYYNIANDHEAIMKCKQIIHELGRWPVDVFNPFIQQQEINPQPTNEASQQTIEPSQQITQEQQSEVIKTFSYEAEKKTEQKTEQKTEIQTAAANLTITHPQNPNKALSLKIGMYQQLCLVHDYIEIHLLQALQVESTGSLRTGILIKKRPCTHATEIIRRGGIDLYHYESVQKIIKQTAEKFQLGFSYTENVFAIFIDLLEQYKLAQHIAPVTTTTDKEYTMTKEEQTEAMENICKENLLQTLYEMLPQTGIIGEEQNAMIITISMLTCRLQNPVSITCLSPSGMGKSYTMDKCSDCMPEEWVKRGTSFTEQSFYHFGKKELKHKIFMLEDATGIKGVEYSLRQLISSQLIIKYMATKNEKTGKVETIECPVEGPLCLCCTTTAEKQYTDNSNRVLEITLDTSQEQDERIAHYQKQLKAGLINKDEEKALQQKLKNMFRMLYPYKIINPYAMVIDVPQKYLHKRRGLQLLLHFIDGVTHLNQYQATTKREADAYGEVVLLTHPTHIAWSFKLLRNVLFTKSDELTTRVRSLYEKIQALLETWNNQTFTAQQIRKALRLEPRTLNYQLNTLRQYGFIQKTGGHKNKGGYVYELTNAERASSLQKEIDEHITTVMEKVWAMYNNVQQAKRV